MTGHSRISSKRLVHLAATLIIVATVLLSACTRPRPTRPPADTPTPGPTIEPARLLSEPAMVIGDQPDMVPGEVIVKLEDQPAFQALNASVRPDGIVATGLDNIDRLNQQFGVTEFDPLIKPVAQASGETLLSMAARQPALLGLYVAGFDSATDPVAVAAAYDAEPGVIYAEPNYYVYASGKLVEPLAFRPNDPYFNLQWNMTAIQAPQAWDISGGQGILVAVLDSGIAYEDFDGYQQAPDLSSTSFVPGYDFLNNDSHANDDGGHGTHVAGTIAQSTDNGVGVAGVAFGATLMPIKVLDSRGQGSFDALAQGIMYAADQGARVINLSLSSRKSSQLLADAIAYAVGKGTLVVGAAGNSGGTVEYPAAYDGVLAVGSVEFEQDRARYSNFGPQVDVVAPGGDTAADRNGDGYPDGILQQTFKGNDATNFALYYLEGTSMAAPHVSGLAAMLFALNPTATADQVRHTIQSTALDLGPSGRDNDYGYGLVQAASALAAMAGTVPPPTPTPPVPSEPTPTPILPITSTPPPVVVPLTPTPTSPGPTTITPAGDLITNGGFEDDSGWAFGSTQRPASYTSDMVHSGARSVRLGIVEGYDIYSYSSIWQTVTIPADARRATLTYWTYPMSRDEFPHDLHLILLLDDKFHILGYADQSLADLRQWIPGSYDMTPFAGRTVTLYFGVYNGGGTDRPSAMYLDDVAVTVDH